MKHLAAAMFCACTLALASQVQAAPRRGRTESLKSIPNWFWGCWVVRRDLNVPDVSGVPTDLWKAIIGSRLVFGRSYAHWGRVTVRPAKYSVKVISAEEFAEEHHGSASSAALWEIGVRAQHVTEVEVALPDNLSDLDFPGEDVYLREGDIVLEVENDFFLAKKANHGDRACSCRSQRAR